MSKVELPSKRNFWPKSEKMPTEYMPNRRIYPCPECNRVRLDDGGQNTITQKRMPEAVIFYCKSCGHRWMLPRNTYVFPKKVKTCDVCDSETKATSTRANVQYRKCINDTCNKRFSVIGKKV